jgi:hypothetical protein
MKLSRECVTLAAVALLTCGAARAQEASIGEVTIDAGKTVAVSKSTPTLQVVVNPQLLPGSAMHNGAFAALHALGADYVRYVPWLPYPRQAVAELSAPADGKTSWDFSRIDPTLDEFMKATEGHSVILNFSTIPAWMFKTDKPVAYPDDPNQVDWNYTQGTDLRDPTMKEAADYYARLVGWYTQGGFTDELGVFHKSGHHYKIAYWEVLNEIDFEHHWTPESYTRFYDAVTAAMQKVDPGLKFMALALANPSHAPDMFEYFLNPANHREGAPLDFITYHFYATPGADQTMEDWQYTFFDEEQGFLNTVRYVEEIRKRLSPSTKTDLDELGAILAEDGKEIANPAYIGKPEPPLYWNLAGALYADLYVQLARMGIEVVGESQLVGYHSQFPSVSMIDQQTGEPNARFWVLKLIKDNFGPGDRLVRTELMGGDDDATGLQAFLRDGKIKLLAINRRNRVQRLKLPKEMAGASVSFVALSTGNRGAASEKLSQPEIVLQPFEVAVVTAQ